VDESPNESPTPRDEKTGRLLGAGAMTALSIAYPFAALWYFWHDWIKYARDAHRVWIGAPGIAVPVNEAMITLLSPWRVALAALTAKLLFSSASKLRKGEQNAKALSFLTLFGLLLPQSFWLFEFVNDWLGGEGLAKVGAMMLAIVALPTLAMARGDGAIGRWGGLDESNKKRVMGAAVGMGWLGMAAMSFVDHSYLARGGSGALWASIATMVLSAITMAGLFKQKTWALFASLGAVGAAGAGAVALSNATLLEGGTPIDGALAAVANAPFAAAAIPALVLFALLRPFFAGVAKAAVGKDPSIAAQPDERTHVRIATEPQTTAPTEEHAMDASHGQASGARGA
jgi:hypothetical protein